MVVARRLRDLQEADQGEYLKSDGSNAAAILKRMQGNGRREGFQRLCRLLARAVHGVEKVQYKSVGKEETIQFRQSLGLKDPWMFEALNMSDGTLRILGLFLAVLQPGKASVVAIEEPESTVRPAVSELIVEVLQMAAEDRQVIVTTGPVSANGSIAAVAGALRSHRSDRRRACAG